MRLETDVTDLMLPYPLRDSTKSETENGRLPGGVEDATGESDIACGLSRASRLHIQAPSLGAAAPQHPRFT